MFYKSENVLIFCASVLLISGLSLTEAKRRQRVVSLSHFD